jgi:hypothetical protein
VRTLVVILVLTAAVAALPAAAGSRVEGVPQLGPVFVIVGENTDYQHVDATNSPFMMTNLRPPLQDGLGLSPYLGAAASVAPLPLTWR